MKTGKLIILLCCFVVGSMTVGEKEIGMKGIPHTQIIKAESRMEFYQELTKQINRCEGFFADAKSSAECRLIVKAAVSDFEFETEGALYVIQGPDHYYVVQYFSTELSEEALKKLNASEAILYAEVDQVEKLDEGRNENGTG